jgi:copper chaperone CopZ
MSQKKILKPYTVTGVHCASYAAKTEAFVKTLTGIESASVNYANTSLQD